MKKIKLLFLLFGIVQVVAAQTLKRAVPEKQLIEQLPSYADGNSIIIKIVQNELTDDVSFSLHEDPTLLSKIKSAFVGSPLPINKLIHQPNEILLALKELGEERSGITLGNLCLYYKIDLQGQSEENKIQIHNNLIKLPELETVYFPVSYHLEHDIEPVIKPTPVVYGTPDLSAGQFYLDPAPDGLNAKYAWTKAGGDGTGINYCDVELGLNKTHEDIIHGNITDISVAPSKIDDHGTAVNGVIYADHNGFGVDGMAHKVTPYFSNAYDSTGKDFDIANAMARAIPYLGPGDVMLLEMMDQSGAPNSSYAPVEFSQAEFDVIQNMTASGIIVIEAAGNGNKNLDDTVKYGHKFDSTYRYSGAFMVGGIRSGVSGGTSPAHQRKHPSSYGSRVDFHAYSEMVTTCGYGDLYGSSPDEKYTAKFFGTSSASPIIAGAAILMESIYKNATGGLTLDHKELKSLLRHGATPSYDPPTDKVGVMPDLKQAIDFMLLPLGNPYSVAQEHSFAVYPSLAETELIILDKENSSKLVNYYISDLSGKQVLAGNILPGGTSNRINVADLSPGMYFISMTEGERSAQIKFVKK